MRVGNIFLRVQVKSVLAKPPSRHHYRITTHQCTRRGKRITYSADEIDFLVAYIFPEDLWYVFPVSIVEGKKSMCVWPGSKRSRFEQYREGWELLKPHPPAAASEIVRQ